MLNPMDISSRVLRASNNQLITELIFVRHEKYYTIKIL